MIPAFFFGTAEASRPAPGGNLNGWTEPWTSQRPTRKRPTRTGVHALQPTPDEPHSLISNRRLSARESPIVEPFKLVAEVAEVASGHGCLRVSRKYGGNSVVHGWYR
jgi:hypothetical protein